MSTLIECGVDGCTTEYTSHRASSADILDELIRLGWDTATGTGKWLCPQHNKIAKSKVADMVNHPAHYNAGKFEVIDVIDDWKLNFARGCVVKYVARAQHKGTELEDLKKAAWYLNYEIAKLEGPTISAPINGPVHTKPLGYGYVEIDGRTHVTVGGSPYTACGKTVTSGQPAQKLACDCEACQKVMG